MAASSNPSPHQTHGTGALEKKVTAVAPVHLDGNEIHANDGSVSLRIAYNGKEVVGKIVLELMALAPPEGSTMRIRAERPDAREAIHAIDELNAIATHAQNWSWHA